MRSGLAHQGPFSLNPNKKRSVDEMKRIITAIMAVVMVLSMSVSVFAASKISEKKAVKIALKSAKVTKAQVYLLESEYDEGKYEVEFTKKSNKAEYSFDISKKGKILEKSIDFRYKKDHSKEKIGKAAAQKKAAKITGVSLEKVKKGTCRYEYDTDDREGKYEVKFKTGSYKYDVDVLAPTGAIMEYDKKYRK